MPFEIHGTESRAKNDSEGRALRLRHFVAKSACAGLVSLALAACSAASPELRAAMQSQVGDHASRAHDALEQNDLRAARVAFQRAASDLDDMNQNQYLANNLYLERSEAAAGLAWVDVLSGNVQAGSTGFGEAIQGLSADERAHIAYLADLDRQHQTALILLGVALAVGAAVADAQASPGYGTPAIDSLTGPNGALEIIGRAVDTMDSTGLAERFVGSESTNTDGVRMLVLPGLNYPINLVGQVVTIDGLCTGSLVGERLVLTAAHCVTDLLGREVAPGSVRFVLESPSYRHESIGKRIYLNEARWNFSPEDDWAVVELMAHPPGFGYLNLSQAPSHGGEIEDMVQGLMLPGFSSDLNDGRFMSLDYGCSPISLDSDGALLNHLCATWKGASGAPVMLAGTNQVIGIHTASHIGTDLRMMRAIDAPLLGLLRTLTGQDPEKPGEDAQASLLLLH